ncbi:MAG: site-specific DNA-methyltransferase [Gammaproteobacteria bacterium]|nr:MAG: site-specific DNA-methyltransferase [Gammaproteobacteria bacterium]
MPDIVLKCDDCRNVLPTIPDNSFKLAITSPPYNLNLRISSRKDGSVYYHSRQIIKEISTKYDGYADNLSLDEWYELNASVVTDLIRVADLTFYNVQMVAGNKPALLQLLGDFRDNIKDIVIWDKGHSQPAMRDGVMNSGWEFIIIFQRYPESCKRRFTPAYFERGTVSNIWRIPPERGKKSDIYHGAVFPKKLVEYIITNFSTEGDWVIDPFMGTGTAGVIAKQLNRNFYGIEFIESYFDYARSRIKDA